MATLINSVSCEVDAYEGTKNGIISLLGKFFDEVVL